MPPQTLPHDEYVRLVDQVIDYGIKIVREDLREGIDPEEVFRTLFHSFLAETDKTPNTDRIHGIASQAIMRLAKALETR